MKSWDVYVTRELPQPAIERLKNHCAVEVNPEDRVLTYDELLSKVKGRDAVLCLLTDTINEEVLDAAQDAKIFANYAVGYNNVDVEAATERGILITNTPGVLTETTAELTLALLFAVARRVVEADRFTRAGKYKGWGPMLLLGKDLYGKTLGVIGAGRIGEAVARKAHALSMSVIYNDHQRNRSLEAEIGARCVDKETLLKESDFISLHVPLLPSTRQMIGGEELEMMKESAILINTSRGAVIDESALLTALREGKIWAAGLDVFEDEPALTPGLAELDNVVLTPHIASASIETRTKMAQLAVDNILAAMEGEEPPNCVNPEAMASDTG